VYTDTHKHTRTHTHTHTHTPTHTHHTHQSMRREAGSRPVDGSSRNWISGFPIREIATERRRFMPPENVRVSSSITCSRFTYTQFIFLMYNSCFCLCLLIDDEEEVHLHLIHTYFLVYVTHTHTFIIFLCFVSSSMTWGRFPYMSYIFSDIHHICC